MTKASTIVHSDGGDPIATILLDGPSRRNALGAEGWRNLAACMASGAIEPARVVAIRGAAGHFGAGADLEELRAAMADPATAATFFDDMEAALAAVEAVAVPTVAVVEGACMGAALSLALACDVRIAATASRFSLPPARLGLLYPETDLRRLIQAVGLNRTKTLLFSGRVLSGEEAFHIGLVDILAEGPIDQIAGDYLIAVASCVPATLRILKEKLADGLQKEPLDETYYQALLNARMS